MILECKFILKNYIQQSRIKCNVVNSKYFLVFARLHFYSYFPLKILAKIVIAEKHTTLLIIGLYQMHNFSDKKEPNLVSICLGSNDLSNGDGKRGVMYVQKAVGNEIKITVKMTP